MNINPAEASIDQASRSETPSSTNPRPITVGSDDGMRAELSAKLAAAQFILEGQLGAVGDNPAAISELRAQLNDVAALQRTIATANAAALPNLRADVAASLTASQQSTSQARTTSAAGRAAQDATDAEAARRTAQSIATDLFERRIFDPYLTFASDAEEAQYRQREAEARRYIDDQLAKDTPSGSFNATGAIAGQMLDAHAHGAGDSPDFAPRWKEITRALDKQRMLMRGQGLSTEECDRNLTESVRRYLAGKGLSAEQIDAQLRQSADPLDAVKPYMRTEQDAKALQAEVGAVPQAEGAAVASASIGPSPQSSTAGGLDAITAKLQASGVALTDGSQRDGHGVSGNVVVADAKRTV